MIRASLALLLALAPSPEAVTWQWPLTDHGVVRRFAPPPAPWLSGHRGVDLRADPGAAVHAAGPGTIGYADQLAGRGVVTVHHPNGLRTTYLPVLPSVRAGQHVTTGTRIGTLQNLDPPHCPQHCLHWGLLRERRYLDPLLLTGTGLVRLLPHWPAQIGAE
ncbi:murein hydrolase activator EnvC family protein [Nonomuraea sp. NPDC059023]|uniref:murein hydrolase activator EnvC family protein n=1 Tax=unclassified Nonomuraea TaxID=2593643 RepID=UPI0036CD833A